MSAVSYLVLIVLVQIVGMFVAEKVRYLITERPILKYWSPKYFTYFNVTCRRLGRYDPVYYFEVHFEARYICPNNVTADVVFYQFLSNQYKRSFVEMHFLLCDIFSKNTKTNRFFGDDLKQGRLQRGCPIPPGKFDLYNMSIPTRSIPHNFPFTKGRISLNLTSTNEAKDLVTYGYVDMEIKEFEDRARKRGKL